MKKISVEELTSAVDGELIGHTDQLIKGPEQIENAEAEHVTFIGHQKFVPLWEKSSASVALVSEGLKMDPPATGKAYIKVKNADLAMAKLLEFFKAPAAQIDVGIHPSAVVHESAKIGQGVKIGAHCYVGPGVEIGDGTVLYPNVTLMDDVVIGAKCEIRSGTRIEERCEIGSFCILHNNVSIGSDGFGYRPSEDGRGIVKIPHIGNVKIGHQVEIGASSCIDRGKFSSTRIGDGTKIDNLVQIGHNCVIGRACLIAGCCGISGSVTLGDGVVMAGQVAVKDHVTIGNGVTIGGKSGVINDIPDGKTVLGFPAIEAKDTLKQWAFIRRMLRNA